MNTTTVKVSSVTYALKIKRLLEKIRGLQTIITCTGLEEFVDSERKHHKIFHVTEGVLSEA